MTFSIVGRDPKTGQLGVAISTAVPNVGGRCPYAKENIGAVASQARSNPYLAIYALKLIENGHNSETALAQVIEWDPGRDNRQVHLVSLNGDTAAYTGKDTIPWSGHKTGMNFSAAGNRLVGPETIEAMAESFVANPDLLLPDKLMAALEAGQNAGGDKQGRVSAALLVMGDEAYPFVRLQVDESPDPVADLRRIYEIQRPHMLTPRLQISRTVMNGHPQIE